MTHRAHALLLLAALCAGCGGGMRDMYDQPRIDDYAESALFEHGQSARPLVPDVVAHAGGRLADASSGLRGVRTVRAPSAPIVPGGRLTHGHWMPSLTGIPLKVTRPLLERGRERYEIYCAPCHSPVGDGDGIVVRRGFPAPPTYHSVDLRNAPDAHLYDVITDGFGRMFPFADRVSRDDRWAIVAYIRALQLSQYAPASELGDADRTALEASEP